MPYRKFRNTPIYECANCDIFYDYKNKPEKCICKCGEFIYHASKKQFLRWRELQLLEKGKFITGLKREVSMPVKINSVLVFRYVADAVYYEKGKKIVEDTKGMLTDVFKLKRKAVEAYYGIKIIIT